MTIGRLPGILLINRLKFPDIIWGDNITEVLKAWSPGESAEVAPFIVAINPVVSSLLDDLSSQIQTHSWRKEWMGTGFILSLLTALSATHTWHFTLWLIPYFTILHFLPHIPYFTPSKVCKDFTANLKLYFSLTLTAYFTYVATPNSSLLTTYNSHTSHPHSILLSHLS